MKKLILLAAILIAANANANAQASWTINKSGKATTPASGQGFIKKHYALTNGSSVVLVEELSECAPSNSLKVPVNGQMVKFIRGEVNYDCWYIPLTKPGRKFLFDAFKTGNTVKIGARNYSGQGFNELIDRMSGDAL